MAPVAFHRALFQRGRKPELVAATHRLLRIGLVFLAAAMAGSLLLVVDQAVGRVAGLVIAPVVGAVFLVLWFVLPSLARGRGPGPRSHGVTTTALWAPDAGEFRRASGAAGDSRAAPSAASRTGPSSCDQCSARSG